MLRSTSGRPGRASVLVLVVVVLGAALAGCSAPPRSLGPLTWSDAIARSPGSRTLTVSADVDRAWASVGCARFTEKVTTHETSGTVSIAITGFAAELPPGTACSAVRVASKRVAVHLRAPLGTRTLVDATTGRTHAALDLAAAPALHGVPAHFHEQVGSWTERTGIVYRWWRRFHPATQIDLYSGPSAAVASYLPALRSDAGRVRIHGASASVERTVSGDTVETRVDWAVGDGRAVALQVLDQSPTPLTTAQVLELARSVS